MAEEVIRARIVFDPPKGGLGSLGSGGGSAGKEGNETRKGIAKIAAGVAVGNAILGGIINGMDALVKSSPQLQATLSVFTKSMLLILKPIGDIIGLVLRPFALAMLKYAIPFYRAAKESSLFAALTTPEEERTEGQKAQALAASQAVGIAGGAAIGAGLGGPVGAIIGGIIGFIAASIKDAFQGVKNIGIIIDGWLKAAGAGLEKIGFIIGEWVDFAVTQVTNLVTNTAEEFTVFFTQFLPMKFEELTQSFTEKWEKIKEFITVTIPEAINEKWTSVKLFFTDTIPEAIKTAWEDIKTLFTDTLPSWIESGFDVVKTFLTDTVPGWFTSLFDKIQSSLDSIRIPFFGGRGGSKKSGGDFVVTSKGDFIQTHPNDTIFATQNPGSIGGSNVNVTFNINALDASSIDQQIIQRIADAMGEAVKRGMSRRTTETIGIR